LCIFFLLSKHFYYRLLFIPNPPPTQRVGPPPLSGRQADICIGLTSPLAPEYAFRIYPLPKSKYHSHLKRKKIRRATHWPISPKHNSSQNQLEYLRDEGFFVTFWPGSKKWHQRKVMFFELESKSILIEKKSIDWDPSTPLHFIQGDANCDFVEPCLKKRYF